MFTFVKKQKCFLRHIPKFVQIRSFYISGCRWWRHQMDTFSALLGLCAGNSPVTGEFPAHRPLTRRFDVFYDRRLTKRLSKQSWGGWWFETLLRSLWRHSNDPFILHQRLQLNADSGIVLIYPNFSSDYSVSIRINAKPHFHWAEITARYFNEIGLRSEIRHSDNLSIMSSVRWSHNGRNSVSNHQSHHCLLNRLFRRRSKKTSKLRVTGLCVWNSPGTSEFPVQMASNAENVSIWWRHHDISNKNHLWLHSNRFVHTGRICVYRETMVQLKTKDRQFDNLVVTGGTVSCHYDNARCNQCWQNCQFDDDFFSVFISVIDKDTCVSPDSTEINLIKKLMIVVTMDNCTEAHLHFY